MNDERDNEKVSNAYTRTHIINNKLNREKKGRKMLDCCAFQWYFHSTIISYYHIIVDKKNIFNNKQ